MSTHKVGGEVDAFCNKCKMELAHTILAMVEPKIIRVKCNTCGGEHAYRGPQQTAKNSFAAPRRRAAPTGEKVLVSFAKQMEGQDPATARPYNPKTTYVKEALIEHPTFGLGIVTTVRLDKVDVTFKAFEKTLVHSRGGEGQGTRPAFQAPRAASSGPADKPVDDGNASA